MTASHSSPAAGRLEAIEITKQFGSVKVLEGVNCALTPGRIHTIIGENGAGKSTLFKILSGLYLPSDGALHLDDKPIVLGSPRAAHQRGIYLVPQEPALMAELSVAETMFVGQLPTKGTLFGRVDWPAAKREAARALAALGVDIDVDHISKDLSIAQQQQVECAKALLRGCRIILFDEPTSPLTSHEVARLFAIMRRLRDEGYTLAFISHRMDEVLDISDDISVLRDGRLVDSVTRGNFDRKSLLSKMVGREMSIGLRRGRSTATTEPVLSVEGLAREPRFRGVSFTLHKGEILGLAGLIGAGRTEIAEAVCGLTPKTAGKVTLGADDITHARTSQIIRHGLVYAPEDRARHGVVLPMSITHNVTSSLLERVKQRFGFLDRNDERRIAGDTVRQYRVRSSRLDQPLSELSGGNQQKVVFGKWMSTSPLVAILDEPTRGVDVGAKDEIYELIDELAAGGLAILVISSEMEELVRICDRILSVYEGQIVAELTGDEITPDRVGASYLSHAHV
ncbi:MAG: sugar ABC transporter ATP-binding protein [Ancalomicrobiaceae bacterium]|nr:sugar ABC transporter ATP-binding protein [Ancalomicrobiaceae bacterium]